MKTTLALLAVTLFATGCASVRQIGTADVVIQAGTNSVRIKQPKDTTIGKLTWDPVTGKIELVDYASTVNAGLVAAGRLQSDNVLAGFRFGAEMLKDMGIAGAEAYTGRTVNRAPAPASTFRIPDGMKAVQRGGEVVFVPRDDPSSPQPEIPTIP